MNKKKILIYVLAIVPLCMVAVAYPSLPDLVPMQWRTNGGIRYDEKWQLFPIAGVSLLMAFFMPLMAKVDPRKKNYQKFMPVYENIILVMEVFMAVLMAMVLSESMNPGNIPVDKMVMLLMGGLFIFLGNVLPKVKSNFSMGIKTPWALSSETVWNKTQRLGGKMFVLCGALLILGGQLLPARWMMGGMIIFVLAILCVPTIMSYVWFQKEAKKRRGAEE